MRKVYNLRNMLRGASVTRLCLVAMLVLAAATAGAQPPEQMHYQGRLTSASGVPITSANTFYFSLWLGGSASTASSGTELYRESISITPDANGIFEHAVGSGTVLAGEMDPSDFNTSQDIWLQVGVGSASNVLLPRTRMTSVGYAFVAHTALYAQSSGLPVVTSVTDATGGVLVVGDLLTLQGEGLASAKVRVGGIAAPIKSQTASQIVCQVPAGVKRGLNAVEVIEESTGGSGTVAAWVDVHRLLVGISASVSSGSDNIFVIDANEIENSSSRILLQFDPSTTINTTYFPLQSCFAHNGALLLVPTGTDGRIIAIDLTLNPPAQIESFNTGLTRTVAVTASPDGAVAVVSDYGGNRLRAVPLNETFPPYTTSLLSSTGSNLPDLPSSFSPRGSAFVSDSLLLALGQGTDAMISYRRTPGTTTFEFITFNDGSNPDLQNLVSAGTNPFGLTLTPDGTRAMITNNNSANLAGFYVGPEGVSDMNSGPSAGSQICAIAMAPESNSGLVVSEANDVVLALYMVGSGITKAGGTEGPDDSEDFQNVTIEPVDGDLAVVGTNETNLFVYSRRGGSLTPLTTIDLTGTTRDTMDLRFQP